MRTKTDSSRRHKTLLLPKINDKNRAKKPTAMGSSFSMAQLAEIKGKENIRISLYYKRITDIIGDFLVEKDWYLELRRKTVFWESTYVLANLCCCNLLTLVLMSS